MNYSVKINQILIHLIHKLRLDRPQNSRLALILVPTEKLRSRIARCCGGLVHLRHQLSSSPLLYERCDAAYCRQSIDLPVVFPQTSLGSNQTRDMIGKSRIYVFPHVCFLAAFALYFGANFFETEFSSLNSSCRRTKLAFLYFYLQATQVMCSIGRTFYVCPQQSRFSNRYL